MPKASGHHCFDSLANTRPESDYQKLIKALVHNSKIAQTPAQIEKVNKTSLATFQKLFPGTKKLSDIIDDPENHLRPHVDLPRINFKEISRLLRKQNIPTQIINEFTLVDIKGKRLSDGNNHFGQILIHKAAVKDTLKLFDILYANDVPIGPIVPAQLFAGSDEMMVTANITSGVNLRLVSDNLKSDVEVSFHTYGLAIDINSVLNKWRKDPNKDPLEYYGYDPSIKGTLVANSKVIREIETQTGFLWGGHWKQPDPQHFTHAFLARSFSIREVDD